MIYVSQCALLDRETRAKEYSIRAHHSRRVAARYKSRKIKGTAICVVAIAVWAIILALLIGAI